MSAPFMQLYVADYLGDTQHLTTEQHGAYLLILMAMWRNDARLPDDPVKLARIARVSPRRWHQVAPDVMAFFDHGDGFITQKRLVEEHQKASSISEKRSASGKLGGDAKALKDKKLPVANASDLPRHSQKPDIRSQKEEDANASFAREFAEEFWPRYPHKVEKPAALKAYPTARGKASLETILAGLDRYVRSKPSDIRFCNPATFLNQERWNDEPAPSATGPPMNGRSSLKPKTWTDAFLDEFDDRNQPFAQPRN